MEEIAALVRRKQWRSVGEIITWLTCPSVILWAFSAAGCWAELEDVIVAVISCLEHKPINEKVHVPVKLRNLVLSLNTSTS